MFKLEIIYFLSAVRLLNDHFDLLFRQLSLINEHKAKFLLNLLVLDKVFGHFLVINMLVSFLAIVV